MIPLVYVNVLVIYLVGRILKKELDVRFVDNY